MRIATWNVERLKHKSKLHLIIEQLTSINADILILTETDNQIILDDIYTYKASTPLLYEIRPDYYKNTENRITIYSKYPIIQQRETYDKYTALCTNIQTGNNILTVYGTIIGIYGNRTQHFNSDLIKQLADFEKLSVADNLCIAGDYNISFCDNYYFTRFGRDQLNNSFLKNNLSLVTQNIKDCIDHIAISDKYINGHNYKIDEWNITKTLSDHKGIYIDLENTI
jgi:hypothetical protein